MVNSTGQGSLWWDIIAYCLTAGRRQEFQSVGFGERGEREPIEDLGAEPPLGSRGKAPGDGQGAKPPEAERLLIIAESNLVHKTYADILFWNLIRLS